MLVAHLVMPEGAVPAKEFVQHASEGEPVGRGIVRSAPLEHLRGHVAVSALAGVGSFSREIAGQSEVTYSNMAILIQQDVRGLQGGDKEGQLTCTRALL